MATKFFITLCFAILLQDAMGSFSERSYNPRFRNVNKKYLKTSPTAFNDREVMEDMYLLDTKTKKLTKADVILVSMPLETSQITYDHKDKHSQQPSADQQKTQKLSNSISSEADSPVIHQSKPNNDGPIVLQLLGWTGNPPPPIVLPPMPEKISKPEMEEIDEPIVIEEEIIKEMKPAEASNASVEPESMISLGEKSELLPLTIVEEKIMNEEPSMLVEPIPQANASEDEINKPSEVLTIKELIVEVPLKSESVPLMDEPSEMESENVQNQETFTAVIFEDENKASAIKNTEEVIVEIPVESNAAVPDFVPIKDGPSKIVLEALLPQEEITANASEDENKATEIEKIVIEAPVKLDSIPQVENKATEIEKIEKVLIEAPVKEDSTPEYLVIMNEPSKPVQDEDNKKEALDGKLEIIEIANFENMQNEEKPLSVDQESIIMSDMIPETLLVMSEPQMIEAEKEKESSESKAENEEMKIEASNDKVEEKISAQKFEKNQNMDEVVESAPIVLEVASENVPIKNEADQEVLTIISASNAESQSPSEFELKKDIIEAFISAEQQETDKKTILEKQIMAHIETVMNNLKPENKDSKQEEIIIQEPILIKETPESSTKVQAESVVEIVQEPVAIVTKLDSKIPEENQKPIEEPKETQAPAKYAPLEQVASNIDSIKADQSLLKNKIKEVSSVESPKPESEDASANNESLAKKKIQIKPAAGAGPIKLTFKPGKGRPTKRPTKKPTTTTTTTTAATTTAASTTTAAAASTTSAGSTASTASTTTAASTTPTPAPSGRFVPDLGY